MPERSETRPHPEDPDHPSHLLLIEDDPGDAYLLQKMLGGAGGDLGMERVASLQAGLERLTAGGVDAVLLDLSLPDSDGLETFRRAHAHSPDLPILVVTGRDDEALGGQAVREGAQDYLVKGQVDGRQLLRAVRYAIERKRAEQEHRRLFVRLLEAQRLESLGAVAGRIGDDINNLLLGVVLNSELAIEEVPAASPLRDRLGEVRSAALRAAELSQQMLAYSGKNRLVVVPFDLSRLVEEMRPLLEVSVPETTRLAYNLGVNLPPAAADATQIRHLLLSLITGAADLRSAGGSITLSTGVAEYDRRTLSEVFHEEHLRTGRFVYLEIADDGLTIPPAARQRIYGPHGGDRHGGAELSGRALGLATALHIVRRYYGALAVDSGDAGTTFKVIVPAAVPADETEHLTLAAGWHDGGTALVIDGEEVARRAVCGALERFGFDVLTAADGQQGLVILRERSGDVRFVVMDVAAARPGPEDVVREMRRIRGDLPVVLANGADPRIEERVAGLGVDAVIRKPYRLATLRETIRGILEG